MDASQERCCLAPGGPLWQPVLTLDTPGGAKPEAGVYVHPGTRKRAVGLPSPLLLRPPLPFARSCSLLFLAPALPNPVPTS